MFVRNALAVIFFLFIPCSSFTEVAEPFKQDLLNLLSAWQARSNNGSSLQLRLLSDNVLSLIHDTVEVPVVSMNKLPLDITYFFADLKYQPGSIKLCEFGGMFAANPSTSVIVNGKVEKLFSPYWCLFWHYLKQFNIPIWYVGSNNPSVTSELNRVGGKRFATFSQFVEYYNALSLKKNKKGTTVNKISQLNGILVVREKLDEKAKTVLKKLQNSIIVVNDYTRSYTAKHIAYPLFDNPILGCYMPKWKKYKKSYSDELIAAINRDIKANFYIIKPINSLRSNGVIMVPHQELDATLKLILQDQASIARKAHKSLAYWKTDKNTHFIIEEYVESKPLQVEGRIYDPTMRIVFFMHHDNGKISVTPAAGFWKIPKYSLDEKVSLTQKHITNPDDGAFYVGLPIEPTVMKEVKRMLKTMLPVAYETMLVTSLKKTKKKFTR